MPNNTHRIRRQQWMVKAPTEADAFTIRQRMRQEWEESLLAAFERAFDEMAPGEETIHLSKLQLDLRVSSAMNLEAELPELIYRQLGERLRAILEESGGRRGGPRVTTHAGERFEQLLHYLRTGSLPWDVAGIDDDATAGELREICRRELVRVVAALRKAKVDAPLLFRLLQLLDEEEIPALVRALLDDTANAGEPVVARILEMIAHAGGDRHNRLRHAATLLAATVNASSNDRPEDASDADDTEEGMPDDEGTGDGKERGPFDELDDLMRSIEDVSRSLEELDELLKAEPDGFDDMMEEMPREVREQYEELKNSPGMRDILDMLPESFRKMLEQEIGNEDADDWGDGSGRDAGEDIPWKSTKRTENAGGFPIAVPNAGLVLLHSFIVPLFIDRGIIEAGATELSEPSMARAAAMLHCIATGRTEPYEFELGLVKVLLGLTPETPLSVADGLLKDDDDAEIDSLLDAAIAHWGALKNTSRDGLRGSFLKRRGLLRRESDGWRLQVEPASFDMLLGNLPWGISIVKLPWMPKPIHVEWKR